MDMATASATPLSFIPSTSSSPSKSPPTIILSPSSPILKSSSSATTTTTSISTTTFHDFHQNGDNKLNLRMMRRRELVKSSGLVAAAMFPLLFNFKEPPLSHAREVEVGSYLPLSPSDPSFVVFKASSKDTPALRAGNVEPYQFIIPPTWKQTRIANILSGNYCQPKCAEPWVEVKFENEKQGKIQVVASPLIRLTNKLNATIEDIGSPEKVIASLGAFVTGNSYDPDELLEASIEKRGDQTYYKYVLETPFALTGSHNLAKVTAKGNTVVLFVASANDRQWPASQKTLQSMLDSFQV